LSHAQLAYRVWTERSAGGPSGVEETAPRGSTLGYGVSLRKRPRHVRRLDANGLRESDRQVSIPLEQRFGIDDRHADDSPSVPSENRGPLGTHEAQSAVLQAKTAMKTSEGARSAPPSPNLQAGRSPVRAPTELDRKKSLLFATFSVLPIGHRRRSAPPLPRARACRHSGLSSLILSNRRRQ